ncbi:MAG: peptidoglycan DD-metalloendopeptidase family protein [Alphaproteobacteria bacterium]|nr:peptidoglycan DD-metalloendopeptidase family protein [Alphaproteobacteria bacterium]
MRYFLLVIILLYTVAVSIGTASAIGTPDKAYLKQVEKALEKKHNEHLRLKQKTKTATKAVLKIQKEMIAVAHKVQEYEETLSELEKQLSKLHKQKNKLLKKLEYRNKQLINILAALENLAWRPTEALIAQPSTPVDTIRSAILMRAAVPQIERAAEDLRLDLNVLKSLKAAVHSQHAKISHIASKMDNEHKNLHTLFQKKTFMQKRFEKKTIETKKRMGQLAKEADDIRDLLVKLEEERKRQIEIARKQAEKARKEAKEARIAAERAKKLAVLKAMNLATKEAREIAALKAEKAREAEEAAEKADETAKKSAAVLLSHKRPAGVKTGSFVKAKGTMPFPARGKIIEKYGKVSRTGIHAKGITLKTRVGAQVIAPYDGTVLFSGPFRGYGQLLIIEHGDGYHTLLAGMEQINSVVRQKLLAGEPVGRMNKKGQPKLYVELRRNGHPINPLPWLVANNVKANR